MYWTGGRALAEQLALEGVRDVFGVPGVQLDPALDGLYHVADRIRFVQTRHEQGAGYMADGYARASGEVGVFCVVPGPGLLNAMAALATAYACSSPVLALVGQIPSRRIGAGLGMLHEIPNQSETLATVTKWSALARRPEDVPGLIREAMHRARAGRPRPVAVELPPDVLAASAELDLVEHPADDATPTVPDENMLASAAQLLETAKRPVLYAGWGVHAAGAHAALQSLAESIGAPVVASLTGPGSLPASHPLAYGYAAGARLLNRADVVLAVGTRFVDGQGIPVAVGRTTKLVLLNADARDLAAPREPQVAILGDARLGLEALGKLVRPRRTWRPADLMAEHDREARDLAHLAPQIAWLSAIRAALPEDGVLVNELTQVGYVAQLAYPAQAPRTFLTPGYQGTLGYGFATALGAKFALPHRAVVSITGDGGFGWNLQELATARKYGNGLVTVVFRNDAFGNVRLIQREQYGGREIAVDLCNPELRGLADAFGVRAARAVSPAGLTRELRRALASGEPTLIDVPVGDMPSPWHLIHRTWWPTKP